MRTQEYQHSTPHLFNTNNLNMNMNKNQYKQQTSAHSTNNDNQLFTQRYGSIKKNKNTTPNTHYDHRIDILNHEYNPTHTHNRNFGIITKKGDGIYNINMNTHAHNPQPNTQQQQYKHQQFQLISRPNTQTKPISITTNNKLKSTIQKLNIQPISASVSPSTSKKTIKMPSIQQLHLLPSDSSEYSPSPDKKYANMSPQRRNSINNMQTNNQATYYNNNNSNTSINNSNKSRTKYKKYKKQQQQVKRQKQQVQINKYFNNQSDIQQECIQGQQIQLKLNTNININTNMDNSQPTKSIYPPKYHHEKQRTPDFKSNIDQDHNKVQINDLSSLNNQQLLMSKQFKKNQNFRITQYDSANKKVNNSKPTNTNQYNTNNTNTNKFSKFAVQSIDNIPHKLQGQSYPSQFIDSRQESNRTKYGPGGLQTLQFNPQQQKFIILDSKQTQGVNLGYLNIIGTFCEDFDVPMLDQLPTPDKSPQELVNIAKSAFRKYSKYNINEQTVINVRKYKNCVHFSFDSQNNILYHYQNSKVYYGCWRMLNNGQGQKHGQGMEFVPHKYKFKGIFNQGKRSGFGMLICFDGSAYVGQWDNGFRHGAGKQLDNQGIIYEGQWKQGKKSGYGKLYNHNSGRLQFQGVFIKGLKNGYGKQYFENGDNYDGNYLNHKFEGKGTYTWKSGACYIGQFRGGKRNGYGIWKSGDDENCDTYQGDYLQDKKHGRGIYRWANGSVYQGQFMDDLKHGAGTIVYQNGKIVHLTFKNGKAQKRMNKMQNEEQQQPQKTQYSDRKMSLNTSQSKIKTNFMLRNRQAARSTQNLNSARSTSTTNSQGISKGVKFNTKSNTKLAKASQSKNFVKTGGDQDLIRLKFDNKQFEKAIGKNWNKNLIITKTNEANQANNNKPQYPRDRNYQGIQYSSNVNMDL